MQLYAHADILARVEDFEPLVAQWERSTHPAQIRLHKYCDSLTAHVAPLLAGRDHLFLHLDIAVREPSRLLHQYDLENYLTPLFGRRWIDPSRFALVSATKSLAGKSRLLIGTTRSLLLDGSWRHLACSPSSTPSSKEWKETIRLALETRSSGPLPPGPAEVHIAWRCASTRNWVGLWKPTGDAMGPVLGYASPTKLYHPNDDRIVKLSLHRNVEDRCGWNVDVSFWWRLAPQGGAA